MIVNQINHLLSFIELFSRQRRPMTLTQIAEALGLAKSTTYNMIETLMARGYLYEVRVRGGYYLSRKLLSAGKRIAEGDPVTAIIQDFLHKLAFETGETAILAVRDKSHVIYLDVVESQQPIRYSAYVGDRRPVYATSGGKAILSSYADDVFEKTLASLDFKDARETTIRDAHTLRDNIAEGIRRGFFLNCSEYTPDVTGIGLPITVEGRVLGLSIAGPNHRMRGRSETIANALRCAAAEIAEALDMAGIGPNSHLRKA